MPFDPEWDDVHQKIRWLNTPDLLLQAWLDANYGHIPKKAVFLDLGCGVGASALYLAHRGYQVIAVDGSREAITKLARSAAGTLKIEPICEDIAKLELPDQSINAVIDICTLQHLPIEEAAGIMEKARTKWMRKGSGFLSKMATGPYDKRLSPVEIRLAEVDDLNRIFNDYPHSQADKITTWPFGVPASHWFVRGGI